MEDSKLKIEKEIEELKKKLTGNLWDDMELKGKIHNMEMKLNDIKPMDSKIDCIGCGS
ncbi:MAG: hypothetical protein OEY33_07255 [Bdellovibrionales bacterium]|jgi:hypothetical protein|nr:hypothetical protein [Bdellovibrionales bacterium]